MTHFARSLPALAVSFTCLTLTVGCSDVAPERAIAPASTPVFDRDARDVDAALQSYLTLHGFTGRIADQLEVRLGRRIDRQLADLGRQLWFDPIQGLNNDNTCGGCHSPTNGFGDTQPIAIGVDNNLVVGPGRTGPRNQRRTPMMINTAFFPTLMWNSRFHSLSGNPFDNSAGFEFPPPESRTLSYLPQLLVAQAFIPPTERVEAAGFEFPGDNFDIRAEVIRRLNAAPKYRQLFAKISPGVKAGGPITYDDFARAISEFEFTQVYANAPIDRFARGQREAMTPSEKRGAVLFFGKAGCVSCHAVSGQSNEMFSDFTQHVAGIPQVAPSFGNVVFDGPGPTEDFGLEQVTGSPADRYMFRTSPLRNVALQPFFMHNGAFVKLEDAIRYHLDAIGGSATYTNAQLPPDLRGPTGPLQPVLDRLDPALRHAVVLTDGEFASLVDFVRDGLLDPNARPQRLRRLIPEKLPSGRPGLQFQ
ncbi:MAG TPA: cytochrome c peroxidase [Gemmatimonadaceae bacterium]